MTDTYYTHEFEQHDGTLPPEDSDDEPFSQPENIREADSLYQAISRAKTMAEERYGVGESSGAFCENDDILFFKVGQPGGYRVRSTMTGRVANRSNPTTKTMYHRSVSETGLENPTPKPVSQSNERQTGTAT